MKVLSGLKLKVSHILGSVTIGILLLGVACGSAAAPETTAPDTSAPAPTAVGAPAQPTAIPEPTVAAEVKVHPGKLVIMMGDLAAERFDFTFAGRATGALPYISTLHAFLLSTNEDKEVIPGLATQWGLSADGMTWTFTIRKGVKWHDGTEVTLEDVLWSLQHHIGPEAKEYTTNGTYQRFSSVMDRIEQTGPDTVSLTTQVPEPSLDITITEVGPDWVHVMPKRDKLHDDAAEHAYDKNPIGAGFMSLKKHVAASVMSFERFDDYYYQPKNGLPEDKRVKFQALDLFLVPEESTRVAAIRAGEADIAPASLAQEKQLEAGGGRLLLAPEGVYLDISLKGCFESQYPCHDRRVRQALDYAINKELMRDELFGGPGAFEVKGWTAVTPSTIGYTPALDPRPFDPDKARQLLADAGYPGGEGFGKLIINTYPSIAMPFQVESAILAADSWKRELGLDTEVNVGDNVALKKRENAGDLNGQIYWRENETRKDATIGGALYNKYVYAESNTRLHEDPDLYRLGQEAFQTLDADERAEAVTKLYPVWREENYHISIGYASIPWGVGARVLTWEPYPMYVHPSALHTITLK